MAALMRVCRLLNSTTTRRLLFTATNAHKLGLTERVAGVKAVDIPRTVPHFLSRHLCTATSVQTSTNNETEKTARRRASSDAAFDFGPIFERFQRNLSSYKRIKPGQVVRLLDLVKKRGSVPPSEASQIIRATGSLLVRESPEKRRQVFQQVHDTLQSLVKNPDIIYYNSVLKTRLENEDLFDPAEILSELEGNLKLKPNRETFQVLIEAYCLKGDIEGATKILEHMKSAGIPISESVFHSMIKGYMKIGDNESALGVLDLMKESNLHPVQGTYTTLMCGFAEQGDYAQIQKIQSEAEYDDVILQPRHLFSVLYLLGKNGHNSAFSQMLEDMVTKFSEVVPYNNEALNCAFRLMACGKDAEALQVFKSIRQFPDEQYKRNLTLNFIDAMVIQDKPYEEIVKMMEDFVASGHLKPEDINTVAHLAVDNRKRELANRAYTVLMEKGEALNTDDIYEMMRIKKEMGDIDGILDVLKLGQQVTGTKHDRTAEFYLFAFDALKQLGKTPEQIFDDMKEKGFSEGAIEHYNFLHAVATGQFDAAKDYLQSLKKDRILPMSFPILYRGLKESGYDIEHFSEILSMLKRRVMPMQHLRSVCTGLLGKILGDDISSEKAEKLVRKYIELELAPLPWNSGRMKSDLKARGVDEKTVQELVSALDQMVELFRKPAETLDRETVNEMAKKLEQDPDSVPLKYLNVAELALLRKYCFNGQTAKVEALKQKMENRGFHFSQREQVLLCLFYLDQKGDADTALKYIKSLTMTMDSLPPRIPIALAHHYVKAGNPNEAIDVLKRYTVTGENSENYRGRVATLLMDVKKKYPDILQQVAQIILDNGYLPQISPSIANIFMDHALERKDSDKIIKIAEQLKQQIQRIPKFPVVLKFFIEQEDPKRLQKVVDMLTEIRDETEVLHHLAVAFLECGRVAQAEKIIHSPGMKATQSIISVVCRQLTNQNLEEVLRQYIKLIKDVPGCDLDEAYFHLIRYYSVLSEPQKALDVLELYKEAGVQPCARTLRYLAKVLKFNNMDIPFRVPAGQESRQPSMAKPAVKETKTDWPGDVGKLDKNEKELIADLQTDKNLAEFLNKLKSMYNNDPVEISKSLSKIFINLFRRQRERFAKRIIWQLGENGEVDILKAAITEPAPKSLIQSIQRALMVAYFKCDRRDEILKMLDNPDISPEELVSTPVLLMMENDPDIFSKLVSLIEKHEHPKDKKDILRDSLLSFYLIKLKFDEAKKLIEQYPDVGNQTNLLYIYNNMTNKYGLGPETEKTVDFLIDTVTANNVAGRKYIMARWLDSIVNSGNIEQALRVLENLRQRGAKISDFFFKNLSTIKAWLTTHGRNVPWTNEEYEEAERIEQEMQSKRVMRTGRGRQHAT